MKEMTQEQKKECRVTMYTKDHMGDFKICDGNCGSCELSYDYVLGYNDGYTDGFDDAY